MGEPAFRPRRPRPPPRRMRKGPGRCRGSSRDSAFRRSARRGPSRWHDAASLGDVGRSGGGGWDPSLQRELDPRTRKRPANSDAEPKSEGLPYRSTAPSESAKQTSRKLST
jgi:hypothetical protein